MWPNFFAIIYSSLRLHKTSVKTVSFVSFFSVSEIGSNFDRLSEFSRSSGKNQPKSINRMCEEIIQLMGARNLNGAFFRGA